MINNLRMLCLMMVVILLTNCATTKTVPLLPAGSKIAIVTGLDHDITYRYVNHIDYLNNDFQYTTYQLTPNASLVMPIKAALEKNGYHVVLIPITNKKLLTQIYFQKHGLTPAQRYYLMDLVNEPVDRIIVLTKTMSEDFNRDNNVGFGYGYIMNETDMYKGTDAFAAINLNVINIHVPEKEFSQKIWATQQVDNRLFADEPSKVTTRSILKYNEWMHERYSAHMLDAMRNAHILR